MTSKINSGNTAEAVKKNVLTNTMLLGAALLWGSGFVYRKSALLYATPFFFNFLRFSIGFVFVTVIYLVSRYWFKKRDEGASPQNGEKPMSFQILGGFLAGTALAFASAFSQWGLLTTTAGKTGFITSLYTIFVPIISMVFLKKKVRINVWAGVLLAILGLFLISGGIELSIQSGDISVFISALLIAVQIVIIGQFSPHSDGLFLNGVQTFFGAAWSLLLALLFEQGNTLESILAGAWPIIYSGVFALGLAYTLQIIAQKKAVPSVAAIIFSMESVFGALFGALLLNEHMNFMQICGCAAIFTAVIISQLEKKSKAAANI